MKIQIVVCTACVLAACVVLYLPSSSWEKAKVCGLGNVGDDKRSEVFLEGDWGSATVLVRYPEWLRFNVGDSVDALVERRFGQFLGVRRVVAARAESRAASPTQAAVGCATAAP